MKMLNYLYILILMNFMNENYEVYSSIYPIKCCVFVILKFLNENNRYWH